MKALLSNAVRRGMFIVQRHEFFKALKERIVCLGRVEVTQLRSDGSLSREVRTRSSSARLWPRKTRPSRELGPGPIHQPELAARVATPAAPAPHRIAIAATLA